MPKYFKNESLLEQIENLLSDEISLNSDLTEREWLTRETMRALS